MPVITPAGCTDFFSCLANDPLSGSPIYSSSNLDNLTRLTSFAVNLAYWAIQSGLFIYALIYLILGIYKIAFGADEDTFKTAKEALLRSLFAILGFILVSSIPWLYAFILSLLGVTTANNIFINYQQWFR